LSEQDHPSEILIYDAIGKSIGAFTVVRDQKNFSFGESLSPGIYFVFIKNDSASDVMKVVKTKLI